MQESSPQNILILAALSVIIICAFIGVSIQISRVNGQISDLREDQIQLRSDVAGMRTELAVIGSDLAGLTARIDTLTASVDAVGGLVMAANRIPIVLDKDALDPAAIADGIYVLEQDVTLMHLNRYGPFTREFTIYHIKKTISLGDQDIGINIGIAVAGITDTPQFYLDYDSDHRIDIAAMRNLTEYLPLGGSIMKSLDEYNSQTIYTAFLRRYGDADHVHSDRLADMGGMAKRLWDFVESQSDRIRELIPSE